LEAVSHKRCPYGLRGLVCLAGGNAGQMRWNTKHRDIAIACAGLQPIGRPRPQLIFDLHAFSLAERASLRQWRL
jgi:hypothetical protein